MKKIFNFILFISTLISSTGFASDTLFKEYKAGENISTYIKPEYISNNLIDCSKLNIPFSEISKCYFIRDDYKIGEEEYFNVVLVTMKDKLYSIIFFKTDNKYKLSDSVFIELFSKNVKSYKIYSSDNTDLSVASLTEKYIFDYVRLETFEKLEKERNSFSVESILIDSNFDNFEFIELFEIIKKEPYKIDRIINVTDNYNINSNSWSFKIQITNPMEQMNLIKEIKKM